MKLIAGTSNKPLAQDIADNLKTSLTKAKLTRFSDGEIFTEIQENIRGEDCFVIQSTSNPANDNLMELLITIDALRRGSATRVTAVMPYYGYARQDRKTGPRTPISAKLVANLVVKAGADRVLTMDLHSGQIQGFFDIPTDNLFASPVFIRDIKRIYSNKANEVVIVSPDAGGVVRARAIASRLGAEIAIIDKRRDRANHNEVMHIIGDVKDRECIIVDDMVDTAGTLCKGADALKEEGATRVSAYITHGVLSGPAIPRIIESSLDELVITDTIHNNGEVDTCGKIRFLTVAPLLAESIKRIVSSESISSLFE